MADDVLRPLAPLVISAVETLQRPATPLAMGQVALFTAKSALRTEPADTSEDACAVVALDDTRAVLAVADGVGGLPGAADAARVALDTLMTAVLRAARDASALREAILDGFEHANRAVIELGTGAATTLAVAELRGPMARTYHVGDSGVLIVGGGGKLKLQTVSHSPVGYAVESGLLDPRDAMQHEDRHLISNAVGSAAMRIEVGPLVELAARDTLLLASDGLLDNLHLEEIAQHLRKGPLNACVRTLADVCRARMAAQDGEQPSKPDDVTFVVFRRRAGG